MQKVAQIRATLGTVYAAIGGEFLAGKKRLVIDLEMLDAPTATCQAIIYDMPAEPAAEPKTEPEAKVEELELAPHETIN